MNLENKLSHTRALLQDIAANEASVVLANSLGAEDMVLTDLIADMRLPIGIFSLDTGRLPAQTYNLMQAMAERYPAYPLRVFFPDTQATEMWVAQHGINAFYQSVELRKACCEVRKLQPLRRALAGHSAWVTGLRREQSVTRLDMSEREPDTVHGLMKYSPLLDWSEADVWAYIRQHGVPYNALHDRHYPSIGCAPCTRAISVGEDVRAGRWWWENPESKECGLHGKVSPLKPASA
ncbi:phosphoadenylyl-sulfate reductase [Craterilacuibacter sinensis]|uniref:Adenosine 5'-phosphosulfate reductase n=1 Tax=Craterilacuibacter sinensis TaxID=2686017 RepID=A0A845BNJ8_9NEIS|nr:phosphoadenylyl-sulfate reductase [Craterilacuibacter sinensis]MXR38167.1 phosphoadenylyl-sulfate reductase [Craterilacuibacter sinensis]